MMNILGFIGLVAPMLLLVGVFMASSGRERRDSLKVARPATAKE